MGNQLHTFGVGLVGFGGDGVYTGDLRLVVFQQVSVVIGDHPLEEGGAVPGTGVGQGGGVDTKLHGGVPVHGLAEGGHDGVGVVPFGVGAGVVIPLVVGVGAGADKFRHFHAGGFTQAHGLGHLVDGADAHAPVHAQFVEEVVAGYLQRVTDANIAMGLHAVGGGVLQTGGLEVFVLIVDTFVVDHIVDGQGADVDTGDGGDHLEGGAGRILAVKRPVIQGQHGVLGHFFVLFKEQVGVVGGVAGADQHFAGAYVHGYHRGALDVMAVGGVAVFVLSLLQHGDGLVQGVLRHLLQTQVQGGLHVVAGTGLGFVVGGQNVAFLVVGIHTPAVHAVEVLFKGGLEAVLAHLGVHAVVRIVLIDFVILFFVHSAHVA